MSFFEPREDDPFGIVAIGGPLNCERLVEAYSRGIFPWPHEIDGQQELLWFCPPERGVLFLDRLKISRRLERYRKNSPLTFSQNRAFANVMLGCARQPRRDQTGTWITAPLVEAYIELHKRGYAHSFEAWQEGKLIGGMYGVLVNGVMSGESVFGLQDNVSKFCLLEAIDFARSQGLMWLDIQMVTPLTKQFGGILISRQDFLKTLAGGRRTEQ